MLAIPLHAHGQGIANRNDTVNDPLRGDKRFEYVA